MTTAHKPATPLPWELEQPAHRLSKRIVDSRQKETVAGIVSSNLDAAYITHAANAYPQLVAALRYLAATVEDSETFRTGTGPARVMAQDLLRALGEDA